MAPYFKTIAKSFAAVTIGTDNSINTADFIEACFGLTGLFELLGSAAFTPVKSDMNGNINKIKTKFNENKEKCATLQGIIQLESSNKGTATEGLLWLKRGLEFTAIALRQNHDNKGEEMSVSFTSAYEKTLKKHHSMLVRPVFTLAMKACPSRKDFYAKLGDGVENEEQVSNDLEPWLSALERSIGILQKIYVDLGLEK